MVSARMAAPATVAGCRELEQSVSSEVRLVCWG